MDNLPFFYKGPQPEGIGLFFEPLTMVFIPQDEVSYYQMPGYLKGNIKAKLSTLEPNLWVDDVENTKFKGFGQMIINQ